MLQRLESPNQGQYSHALEAIETRFVGATLDTNFRHLVGALPSDELTHAVYPYPARLVRHIPRFLLNCEQVVEGIDHVIDPFCGSGTVLVEAQERGLNAFGIDQNPIATLVSRVKTTPISRGALALVAESALASARRTRQFYRAPNYLRRWYAPDVFSALARLRLVLLEYDGQLRDALDVAFALTARRVADTDRRIPVPVRPRSVTNYTARDTWSIWIEECARLARRLERLQSSTTRTQVVLADSRKQSAWRTAGMGGRGLVLTSPPYGAAQKYIRSTSLELGWLGLTSANGTIELERQSIGREHITAAEMSESTKLSNPPEADAIIRTIGEKSEKRSAIYANYFRDMGSVLDRVSENALRVGLVSGTNVVSGIQVATHSILAEMLIARGFTHRLSMRDQIRGRAFLTKRKSGAAPANAEFVDLFERE